MLANSGLNTTEPIPKKNTRRAYAATLSKFISDYGNWNINDLTSDEALLFLNKLTEGNKPQTKKIRYAHLSSFFNFIRNNIDQEFRNSCDNLMIKKLFRSKIPAHWNFLEKETVDEIIFGTRKSRNRLMLELMARGGMRIGEVLKLTLRDIQGWGLGTSLNNTITTQGVKLLNYLRTSPSGAYKLHLQTREKIS